MALGLVFSKNICGVLAIPFTYAHSTGAGYPLHFALLRQKATPSINYKNANAETNRVKTGINIVKTGNTFAKMQNDGRTHGNADGLRGNEMAHHAGMLAATVIARHPQPEWNSKNKQSHTPPKQFNRLNQKITFDYNNSRFG